MVICMWSTASPTLLVYVRVSHKRPFRCVLWHAWIHSPVCTQIHECIVMSQTTHVSKVRPRRYWTLWGLHLEQITVITVSLETQQCDRIIELSIVLIHNELYTGAFNIISYRRWRFNYVLNSYRCFVQMRFFQSSTPHLSPVSRCPSGPQSGS